jgi:signal transduction histidine kinase
MSNRTRTDLHPCLCAFPGVVLEISPDGAVLSSNRRLESLLGRAATGLPLERVFDDASAERVLGVLESGRAAGGAAVLELALADWEGSLPRRFYATPREEEGEGGVWLVELAAEPPPGLLAHESLEALDSELRSTRDELAKKSGRLHTMVDEIERKLDENERLSAMLQYRNEEVERQNEELLAITEKLHAGQEALLQAHQQLEMRSRQLQVALSARNRFYAAMSHELRTPINAVMGYNDLLLAGIYGPLNEHQELAVERSQRAVRNLRSLVNDVLDISTIELGRMELVPERVEVRQLVESLFVAMRPLAESQGSTLHLAVGDCAAQVLTDPRCVRQILLNIISHSIRLAGGSPVWVQCSADPSGVGIEVTDSGGGMSPEDLGEVFDEFAPLTGSASPSPTVGTGLGLPVARRLAALIGGRLEASTTPGVGNVFHLTLPLTQDHPLPARE